MAYLDQFVKVLSHIEMEKASWFQPQWGEAKLPEEIDNYLESDEIPAEVVAGCASSHCMAGWTCVLNDVPLKWQKAVDWDVETRKMVGVAWTEGTKDGRLISEVAAELLGIDNDGLHGFADLFEADNSLDDLYRISAGLLGMDEQELRRLVQENINTITKAVATRD